MHAESFLDTNVLVYDESKRQRALDLIESENFGISTQVLQEFYVTVVRKAAVRLTSEEALAWLEQLMAFPNVVIDTDLVKSAVETSLRHQITYWDAAIVAAAESLGAKTLYTEDLNHGQLYGSVRVINPFRQN